MLPQSKPPPLDPTRPAFIENTQNVSAIVIDTCRTLHELPAGATCLYKQYTGKENDTERRRAVTIPYALCTNCLQVQPARKERR